eukprot:Nitzschia sp. Nitz4//scaffold1_size375055//213114//213665//NITZ4_000285-RA/size375055-processed-gene-0.444-mRNA-1//-1//CDS//3329541072//1815//frame0
MMRSVSTAVVKHLRLQTSQVLPAFSANRVVRPFSTEKVPDKDYVDGHLLTKRLEYVDDILDKTLVLESYMEDLQVTYAEKRRALEENRSLAEMEKLFMKAKSQKQWVSTELASIKAILMNAKTAYAVDSPDGTSDASEREALGAVNAMIDHAAKHEDHEKVDEIHRMENAVKKDRVRDPEHDW